MRKTIHSWIWKTKRHYRILNIIKNDGFLFDGNRIRADFYGDFHYGIMGDEMFKSTPNIEFGGMLGRNPYIVNSVCLAHQISNYGGFKSFNVLNNGSYEWILIRINDFSYSGEVIMKES